MARHLTVLTPILEEKLNDYMKGNNIKSRSKAIRMCVELATSNISLNITLLDITSKINTLLYRTNIIKKLEEQEFVNHGFPFNDDVLNDKALNEFYVINNPRGSNMLD